MSNAESDANRPAAEEGETLAGGLAKYGRMGGIVAALGMSGLFAVAAWFALHRSNQDAPTTDPVPLIKAEAGPVKEKPEDPGGLKIPNQDKLVFERITPETKLPINEKLAPAPEEPIVRSAEAKKGERKDDSTKPDISKSLEKQKTPKSMETLESTKTVNLASDGPKAESLLPVKMPIPERKLAESNLHLPKAEMNAALATNEKLLPQKPSSPKLPALKEPTVVALAKTTAAKSSYRIQIAAYRDDARAKTAWVMFKRAHKGILGPLTPITQRVDLGKKGIYFRVQAGYFSTAKAARAACAKLKAKMQSCIIIPPKLDGRG